MAYPKQAQRRPVRQNSMMVWYVGIACGVIAGLIVAGFLLRAFLRSEVYSDLASEKSLSEKAGFPSDYAWEPRKFNVTPKSIAERPFVIRLALKENRGLNVDYDGIGGTPVLWYSDRDMICALGGVQLPKEFKETDSIACYRDDKLLGVWDPKMQKLRPAAAGEAEPVRKLLGRQGLVGMSRSQIERMFKDPNAIKNGQEQFGQFGKSYGFTGTITYLGHFGTLVVTYSSDKVTKVE